MKALAINGSPRSGGNTEIMLQKVLEPLKAAGWSTEYLRIGGKPVRGCIACGKWGLGVKSLFLIVVALTRRAPIGA